MPNHESEGAHESKEIAWGQYLRDLRTTAGFGLTEFAEDIGISKQATYARERTSGPRPTSRILDAYSTATGVPREVIESGQIPDEIPWKPLKVLNDSLDHVEQAIGLSKEAGNQSKARAGELVTSGELKPNEALNVLQPLISEAALYESISAQTTEFLANIRTQIAEFAKEQAPIPFSQSARRKY